MAADIQKQGILKIAVVGPESTGKSVLSQALARHYHTGWVPEFSRAYCQVLQNPCTMQDELNIFKGQILEEEKALKKGEKILFCDTTILTVKIWCEHVFGFCPAEVLDEIKNRKYDFYLLTDIDLPWEEDPLRDFPEDRPYFFELYQRELRALQANFQVISGTGEERTRKAIMFVDKFLKER